MQTVFCSYVEQIFEACILLAKNWIKCFPGENPVKSRRKSFHANKCKQPLIYILDFKSIFELEMLSSLLLGRQRKNKKNGPAQGREPNLKPGRGRGVPHLSALSALPLVSEALCLPCGSGECPRHSQVWSSVRVLPLDLHPCPHLAALDFHVRALKKD